MRGHHVRYIAFAAAPSCGPGIIRTNSRMTGKLRRCLTAVKRAGGGTTTMSERGNWPRGFRL